MIQGNPKIVQVKLPEEYTEYIQGRAASNHRSVTQETLYLLDVAKATIEQERERERQA